MKKENSIYHRECQDVLRQRSEYQDFLQSLIDELGFNPVDLNVSHLQASFEAAENRLFERLDFDPFEQGYSRTAVIENPDVYYFPIGWIGCTGHLVVKENLEVVQFGSYVGYESHIWAYFQGISMATLGKDRKNDITILDVFDRDKTIATLERFLDVNYLDRCIVPQLRCTPVKIESVDLYFGIQDLLKATYHNWFRFEISNTPTTRHHI